MPVYDMKLIIPLNTRKCQHVVIRNDSSVFLYPWLPPQRFTKGTLTKCLFPDADLLIINAFCRTMPFKTFKEMFKFQKLDNGCFVLSMTKF